MRRRVLIAILALVLPAAGRAAPNRPFGAHATTYAAGAIGPSHRPQVALDQTVRDFYDAWKAAYVRQGCGAGRCYVLAATGGGNLTVSEAHGYGMMLAALMAGHDPEARAVFDGMVAYFRDHPTATHAHLMSWWQDAGCANGQGNDSAADGDLDVAYALLLADAQWGSCGAIDYLTEARAVLADVKAGDLDQSARYVLLGDWVLPADATYYPSTRSSDFMPDHYRAYRAATGDPAWDGLRDRTYQLVDALQAGHAPATGLLPDFAVQPLGAPAPAPPHFLEGRWDGAYGYNACRTPWRLATDFLIGGDARARTAVQRMNVWIRQVTGGDPAKIRAGYQLDGSNITGRNYLSMAFVAPFGVGAMVDAANQTWLNAVWDVVAGTPLAAEGYYENTLKLLAMIVMSGNWWAPQVPAAGGCNAPPPCVP
jgi:endo-1,4-beta-D-glucanase Y